ncbi:MAG: septum site-determining protein MinC [Zoogloeaceae bacterium]|jgi:septum site-determining protein MinC|nr:septum site-determining protein MinC [Zoogloeaceae bacterium]
MKKSPAAITFKGSTVAVIVISLQTLTAQTLADTAQELFGESDFFDGDAGVLDLTPIPEEAQRAAGTPDWLEIRVCFARHGLNIVGLRGGIPEIMASARVAGLAWFSADERRSKTQEAAPQPAGSPQAESEVTPPIVPPEQPERFPASPSRRTLLVDRPLRSGQQLYARDCDLVITAIVNPGAEVIADGNIHIYAPLRGRALAGASGDRQTRIFATCFEAELVAIAGVYRTFEGGVPQDLGKRPVQISASADDDKLQLTALKLD